MAAGRTAGFYRYSENRPIKNDVSGFDEYIDAPEVERASVEDHIPEENNGYKLISKMGWCKGRGLGREEQGDQDPIPFRPKDDHMGIGRWQFELENAQDATEKRRQLEIEKEITPELAEQYKIHADREKKMAEVIAEMKKSFYCQLCDKQYNNYKEYDNHINSYSHAHNQRLKQLKEYEMGRRFGGRKDKEGEQERQRAQRIVAKERALMNMKRQVAFASGGMLSAFKPVGDGSHEPTTSSDSKSHCSDSKSHCSDSIPQSTSSHSTPTLYYPVVTSTGSQPWEPAVLIKPHPPTIAVTTATPTKRKVTSGKAKVKKKKKKQEIDHSGFVPRKIASSSSLVKNPLLVTPLPSEKKEENESVKENDDLFSLYDDFDVAPAATAPPTDNTTCSSISIWDSFEATTVQQQQQQQQQQSETSDSEGSCDVSSDEECLDATPTMEHVSQPVTEENTESVDEVQEKNGSGSLQQPDKAQPVVEESRNERLLRLLGMPMKSFLSAGHQRPLKEHTSVKVTNSGSYLDKPHPSKYCTTDNNQTAIDHMTTTVSSPVNDNKSTKHSSQYSDVKKPDGLSFGLLKKREKLRQATTGQLFDKEDSS